MCDLAGLGLCFAEFATRLPVELLARLGVHISADKLKTLLRYPMDRLKVARGFFMRRPLHSQPAVRRGPGITEGAHTRWLRPL